MKNITEGEVIALAAALSGSGGGGSVTVDDEMSSTSTNPVQNKVITSALSDKADLIDGKVPSGQLPSYVDDAIEGYYYEDAFYEDAQHTILITGERGKIYIDLDTNKSYRWSGSVYVEISSGGGSAELSDDMTTALTVGGISAGSTYNEGTSLETIIRDMLEPTLYPTIVAPSVTISLSPLLYEKGTDTYVMPTMTANRGSITPAYGTNGYRAGEPDTTDVKDTYWEYYDEQYHSWMEEFEHDNGFRIIDDRVKKFRIELTFADGEQPKDSKGNNYLTPYHNANGERSNTIEVSFAYAIWANTSNITTVAKLALLNNATTKQKDFSFPAQTVANPEIFDIPASWTVTAVQVKNDLSGAWEDASSQFTVTDTTHNDAGGNSVNYKRYTFNMGVDTGARQIRVKWS